MGKDSAKTLLHLKNVLEGLCCPYIEDGSEQWLAELLLHPSESRMKLLHWLVTTFDQSFNELLDNSLPVISNRVDSRQQKFLLILNLMGVCKIDDLELVRGTASQKKQLKFWCLLIDMCYISQYGSLYRYQDNTDVDTSYYIKPARLPTQHESFEKSCKFIDTLVRQFKMNELFSSFTRAELEEMNNTCIPSVEMLIETGESMRKDIQITLDLLLKVPKTQADFNTFDQQTVENYCRKIDLSLKMFSQMVDSFIHCFDNEIDTWCNKPKPELSEIGPMIKTVSHMLEPHESFYENLNSLNQTSKYLSHSLKNDVVESKRRSDVTLRLVDEYRETISVLEESIRRDIEAS